MRLLEALENGKKLYPEQNFGSGFGLDGKSACVNVTLYKGSRYLGNEKNITDLFPVLQIVSPCPECSITLGNLAGLNIHLNDYHQWTREQIVYWASQFEPDSEGVKEVPECVLATTT